MANSNITDWEDITDWQTATPEDSEPGMLTSAALGAAQGISLGFADEAEALVRSALSGNMSKAEYDTKLAEIRERYKRAEEANPMSTLAGNLVGGIVMPGIGAASGAMTAAKAAKIGATVGAVSGLGSSTADLVGALPGVEGEGNLAAAAEDTLTGAAAGALTGAAIPAAVKLGKFATGLVSDTDIVNDFLRISKDASKGITHYGKGMMKGRVDNVRNVAKELIDSAAVMRKAASDVIDAPIEEVTKKGSKSDVSDILNIFKNQPPILDKATADDMALLEDVTNKALGRGDIADIERSVNKQATEYIQKQRHKLRQLSRQLEDAVDDDAKAAINSQLIATMEDISSLTNFVSGKENMTDMPVGSREMLSKIFVKASNNIKEFDPLKSPKEIRDVTKRLNAVYGDLKSPQGKKLIGEIKDSLENKMFSSDESANKDLYKAAMEKYGNVKDVLDEKRLAESFGIGESGDEIARQKSLANTVKQLTSETNMEGSIGRKFFEDLGKISPIGKEIGEKAIKASEELRLTSALNAVSPFAKFGVGGLVPSGKSALMRFASAAGTGIGKVDKAATGAVKLATNIPNKILSGLNSGDSTYLAKVANKVKDLNTATSVDLYNKLANMTNMTPTKQKVLLFTLMQQPQYRQMFDAISPDLNDDGN